MNTNTINTNLSSHFITVLKKFSFLKTRDSLANSRFQFDTEKYQRKRIFYAQALCFNEIALLIIR